MREVFIKHNPYRLTTEVLIDSNAPKANSRLNFEDRRLQEWVDQLPEILLDECNTRDFDLTFHGTLLDYEDIEAMAQDAAKKDIHIKTSHVPAKEVHDKETAITEIFNEIQNGPFDELKKPDVIRAFNMAKSKDFEVNVVATMSAGKSTLINSLLQNRLMPAKAEACTATITELRDNDSDHFSAKVYDKDGNLIQQIPNLTFEIMDSLNSDPRTFKICADGDIPFVGAEDVSLVLVDTPGPNNSRDLEHKAATYRMLSESSKTVVLYILNATQLATNDDNELITHVAESMKVGGKQSRDRFIFVVNKLDDFKKGEDSVQSALSKVRDYLKEKGINNPNIYPASALTALNIRTLLKVNDDDDDDEVYEAKGKVRKFNKNPELHFEKIAPLSPSAKTKVESMLAQAVSENDTHTQALIHCGIVPIETAIETYVQKYASSAKIKNIVDTFSYRLESAKSFENTKNEIRENQDKRDAVLKSIDTIQNKLASGDDAKEFLKRIDSINYDKEIRKSSDIILEKNQQMITETLTSVSGKMSVNEAKRVFEDFSKFSSSLQAELQIKLEDLISNHIHKNAEALFDEYKKKISALSEDLSNSDIDIDPFEMIEGDMSIDMSLIDNITETESVVVGREWVENTNKKWYKPWTWFQESGFVKNVYEDRDYVDGQILAERFFAPVQESLYTNCDNAIAYAKSQSKKIKENFKHKFKEIDKVLENKLIELKECAEKEKDIEKQIDESNAKLDWLEHIQEKISSILDI